jgi:ABC-type lipoprotein export system ATPase subunit
MKGYDLILELKNIEKRYVSPAGEGETVILKNLSLQVAKGEAVAVIGPSGSGKSTLLNMIGALDRPDTGKIIFDNQDLANLNEKQLAGIRNRKIGFVFQLHHLLPQCTVLENVLIPSLMVKSREKQEELAERAQRLLQRVGLEEHMQHRPAQLSGGEMQRAAVVRALINQPALLLADEPTGSLDQRTSNTLGQLLVELNKEVQVTLIVVTHSHELAKRMGTLYELVDGKLEKIK